jgi:glutathione S-transferase
LLCFEEFSMSELHLYTNPQSRGRIAHWMMEELGLPYETHWLDYGTTMKAPDYLAINPMGKVPALRHGSAVVTEAAAICAYLADAFPDQGLKPASGTPESAAYHRWLFFAAGPLEQAVVARSMGWAVPEGRSAMVGFGSYEDTLNALELALSAAPYVCGERFTAADVYVGSSVGWGLMFGTIEKRPVFEAYAKRLQSRPAALRADGLNEAHMNAQS